MKVSEFFLGFGKRIWSFTRGETEFGIKAIPAGGYCRIEGMTPLDTMPAGEESRAFFTASSGKKLIVLGAGSFAHFVIGFLLIFSIFFGVGFNALLPNIVQISPNSAAAAAGFKIGDEVISINGTKVNDWYVDSRAIGTSEGKEFAFVVNRGGKNVAITATPQYVASEKKAVSKKSVSKKSKR
jgi:membrane-associated protease RseP (regulator of RpoE activity)